MTAKLIKIGNSRGVRIPKEYLEGWDENQEINISKSGNSLIISPKKTSRENWVDQMKQNDHSETLDEHWNNIENEFDKTEWEW